MYFVFLIIGLLIGLKLIEVFFPKLGLLDKPKKYNLDRSPIPYSAGLIFYLVFGVALLVAYFTEPALVDLKLLVVFLAASVLVLVSFIDDRRGLSPYLRLFVQGLVVAAIVASGVTIYGVNLPFFGWLELGQIGGGVLTWIWMVLLINVINWLDGRPILASSVSGIAYLVLFGLAIFPQFHTLPQEGLSYFSLTLAFACLIYTFWNVPKPRMLMGDTGSMFLGLMVGVLSVYAGGKLATAALVLALPMFDVFWIILRRLWQGKSPFEGDFKHLHHRLGRVGLSDNKLTLFYSLFSLGLGGLSLWLLSTQSKGMMTMVLFIFLLLGAVLIVRLERN